MSNDNTVIKQTTPLRHFDSYAAELATAMQKINKDEIDIFAQLVLKARNEQHTVFIIGNGGSASTASHWATDLSKGLFHTTGKGVKALSLVDNTAWISATANDIGYEHVFSDQLRTHGRKGDLLVSISASGNSENIIHAINTAHRLEMQNLAVVGFDGGRAKDIADYTLHIPTAHGRYGVVEDIQLAVNHYICDYIARAED